MDRGAKSHLSPFVSAAVLRAWQQDERPLVVIDVRFDTTTAPASTLAAADRIPRAVFADINIEAASEPGPKSGRLPLPAIADLQRDARRWGIDPDTTVVVYDDGKGTSAARLWWVLTWAGLEHVYILDGGYTIWKASGFEVTREAGAVRRGDVRLSAGHLASIEAEEARDLARSGVLLDARPADAYAGVQGQASTGHIPGARSLPAARLQDKDGRVKTSDQLKDLVVASGVDLSSPTIGLYCGSGVAAAYGVAALRSIGIQSSLYPGSWSEWVKDPEKPVAQGADPG